MRALAFLAACGLSAAAANAQVWAIGDAVIFQGRIEGSSVEAFVKTLDEHPEITRLVITSGGGEVNAGLDMGEAIHARQLDVEVPAFCLSSCANYVFPAARRKRLGHPLAVGWHGNMTHVLFMQLTGQVNYSDEMMRSARHLVRRESGFYPRLGVDGFVSWFAKIAPYEVKDYYTLAPADMARFGITGVEVMPGPAPTPDDDTPVLVSPDFKRLERERPAMPLDP
jgi:hypothetical protein